MNRRWFELAKALMKTKIPKLLNVLDNVLRPLPEGTELPWNEFLSRMSPYLAPQRRLSPAQFRMFLRIQTRFIVRKRRALGKMYYVFERNDQESHVVNG